MSRAVVLLVLVGVSLFAQVKLFPIDHTARDRYFTGYVKSLKQAVSQRNVKALRRLVADDVVVEDKPERKGWKEFAAKWKPEDPKSRLWAALEDFLDLGFVQEHPYIFLSPYVVWRFPDNLDPAAHWVVAWGEEILRAEANARAREIHRMEFEIVRRVQQGDRFHEVETLDGKRGWVNKLSLKDPTMPRAQFSYDKGQWLMVMLVDYQAEPPADQD
ncbi:MAG: hypothetical protein NW208_07830 [Bryobacter sp.]|nr:hypothetical protein [Bryobacter sp.]